MALSRPTQLNDLYRDVALINPVLGEVLTRGATHWTNGAAAVGMTGGPINPKDYGAIGDGTNTFITQADIDAHPEWLGTYNAEIPSYLGDTWDYVGLQEAIYAAYGGPGAKHSYENPELNREVYIPPGKYQLNRRLLLVDAIGVIFAGAGRFTTKLVSFTPDEPCLETNMVYSVIRDLMFEYNAPGQHCTVPTACVEWTWAGGGDTAGGLAQLSVYDCEFLGGGYNNTIGFRCARDLYQGDNLVFHNCFFASCFYAGFMSGEGAQNALNMCFHTCNFQRCPQYGILAYTGNIICIEGSFQNGQVSAAEQQRGWDIRLVSSANSGSVIHGNRTESRRFLHADSSHAVDVRACSVITGPTAWAPGTAHALGAIRSPYVGQLGDGPNQNGLLYVCAEAGTSGGLVNDDPPYTNEPAWDRSSVGVVDQSLFPVVWAVAGPHVAAPAWVAATEYVVGDEVEGDDGNDYVCVVKGTSGAVEPLWNSHPGITDGTCRWVVYNYNVLEFDFGTIENCNLPFGMVTVGGTSPCRIINCTFSRDDWLYKTPGNNETTLGSVRHYNVFAGNQVLHALGPNNGAPQPYRIPSYGYGDPETATFPDHVEAYSHFYLPGAMPLVWARRALGLTTRSSRDVGFWPPGGYYADGGNADLSQNVVGILGALAPRHAEGANLAGADLLIQGGLGTGTGASGRIRLRTAVPGGAGSDVNVPAATRDALDINHLCVQAGLPFCPRAVTTAQRDALTGLTPGAQVWNYTEAKLQVWNGFAWEDASPGVIAWTPLTQFGANLQGWWTVDDPATLWQLSTLTTAAAATNDPIGAIEDKSGNSRDLLQATAGARPFLTAVVTEGRRAVRFAGVDEFLQTAAFDRYPDPTTVVIVLKSPATGGYLFTPGGATLDGTLSHGGLGTQLVFSYGANLSIAGDVQTQFGTIICTYDAANSEAWLNGTRFAAALTAGALPQGLTLGAAYNGSGFGQLDFCEAFIVDRALTDTEVDQVNLYCARWGTPEPHLNG
jgi:hypothetical protein